MIRYLAPLALAVAGLAVTTPVLAEVKDDYMAACMEASGDNTELCTCKTEQAVKLVDEELLKYAIINFQDSVRFTEMVKRGEVPSEVVAKWPFYVRDTNKVCITANG